MTALSLFTALGDLIPEAIEREFGKNDNCILATRLAIEVASYFRIPAYPLSVQVFLFNAQAARHVMEEDDFDVFKWHPIDGSHSVGIGCGFRAGQPREGRWDGHLIAASTEGCFGDFAIRQAERVSHGIVTGPALVGPLLDGIRSWSAIQPDSGTTILYKRTNDPRYRFAPDWRDEARRKKLSGPLIRAIRDSQV
jgi:hypothetical protein